MLLAFPKSWHYYCKSVCCLECCRGRLSGLLLRLMKRLKIGRLEQGEWIACYTGIHCNNDDEDGFSTIRSWNGRSRAGRGRKVRSHKTAKNNCFPPSLHLFLLMFAGTLQVNFTHCWFPVSIVVYPSNVFLVKHLVCMRFLLLLSDKL